jgi:hypothetical protein
VYFSYSFRICLMRAIVDCLLGADARGGDAVDRLLPEVLLLDQLCCRRPGEPPPDAAACARS